MPTALIKARGTEYQLLGVFLVDKETKNPRPTITLVVAISAEFEERSKPLRMLASYLDRFGGDYLNREIEPFGATEDLVPGPLAYKGRPTIHIERGGCSSARRGRVIDVSTPLVPIDKKPVLGRRSA